MTEKTQEHFMDRIWQSMRDMAQLKKHFRVTDEQLAKNLKQEWPQISTNLIQHLILAMEFAQALDKRLEEAKDRVIEEEEHRGREFSRFIDIAQILSKESFVLMATNSPDFIVELIDAMDKYQLEEVVNGISEAQNKELLRLGFNRVRDMK